jgi:hypothetical protein
MKLGINTASLVNYMYSRYDHEELEINVGDPATLTGWTDRYAATVINLFTKGKYQYVVLQADHAKIVGGTGYGDEVYEYSRDPDGSKSTFRIVDGSLKPVYKNPNTGRYKAGNGGAFIGRRESYRDPSF